MITPLEDAAYRATRNPFALEHCRSYSGIPFAPTHLAAATKFDRDALVSLQVSLEAQMPPRSTTDVVEADMFACADEDLDSQRPPGD